MDDVVKCGVILSLTFGVMIYVTFIGLVRCFMHVFRPSLVKKELK